MLGTHALYKIDCLEVSLLYLLREISTNEPLEQRDDVWWESVKSILSSIAVLIVF